MSLQPQHLEALLHGPLAPHAEQKGRRISQRIKDALAAKKARGEAVGNGLTLRPFNGTRAVQAAQFAIKLRPTIDAYRSEGRPSVRWLRQ